jgi:hypothetical protein
MLSLLGISFGPDWEAVYDNIRGHLIGMTSDQFQRSDAHHSQERN